MAELDRAGCRRGAHLAGRGIDGDEVADRDGGAAGGEFVHAHDRECAEFPGLDVELGDPDEASELHDVAGGDVLLGRVVDGLAALNVTCFHFMNLSVFRM